MYHLLSWKHSFYSPDYKNNLIGDLSSEMPFNEDSDINVGFFNFKWDSRLTLFPTGLKLLTTPLASIYPSLQYCNLVLSDKKITVTKNMDKTIAMRMVNIKAPRTFSVCVFQQVGCLVCFLISVCAMVGNYSKNFIPDGTIPQTFQGIAISLDGKKCCWQLMAKCRRQRCGTTQQSSMIFSFFEVWSPVQEADLNLATYPRMILNFRLSGLHFPNVLCVSQGSICSRELHSGSIFSQSFKAVLLFSYSNHFFCCCMKAENN